MNKQVILTKMFKIQQKYNNNVNLFQKDKDFINLASLIKNTKMRKIHLQKIKIIENKD